MFNVILRKDTIESMEKKGFRILMNVGMISMKNLTNETIIELIYEKEQNDILVLTRNEFFYCSIVEFFTYGDSVGLLFNNHETISFSNEAIDLDCCCKPY